MPGETDALKRIFASGGTQTYVEVLEFRHPGFSKTWRICNHIQTDGNPYTFKWTDNSTFTTTFVPFEIALPRHDGQGNQDMQIVIGNVGRELMDELEAAQAQPQTPIQVTMLFYLDVPNSGPQSDPIILNIAAPVATLDTVTLEASRFDCLNKPFPALSESYRIDKFPGLDR